MAALKLGEGKAGDTSTGAVGGLGRLVSPFRVPGVAPSKQKAPLTHAWQHRGSRCDHLPAAGSLFF